MISFVTAVKLVLGYEDFVFRLKVYIECIAEECTVPYEIIIVEERDHKNVALVCDFLTDPWLAEKKARVVGYNAYYPNPHTYNMIEAYAKNVGIKAARYNYICVTNCDLFFNAAFFRCLPELKQGTLYRFLQFETCTLPTRWEWDKVKIIPVQGTALNPSLINKDIRTINTVAYKSGDIMLMHRDVWSMIKGFPENEEWVHSDLVVCAVVCNNNIPVEVPSDAFVYTYPQIRTVGDHSRAMAKAKTYLNKKECN